MDRKPEIDRYLMGGPFSWPSTIELLAEHFLQLAADLGLQTKLSQMNIAESDLPKLAEEAMLQQRLLINNPRELSLDDALSIYQQAF